MTAKTEHHALGRRTDKVCRRCLYTLCVGYMDGLIRKEEDLRRVKAQEFYCTCELEQCAYSQAQAQLAAFVRTHIQRGVRHVSIAFLSDKYNSFKEIISKEGRRSSLRVLVPDVCLLGAASLPGGGWLAPNPYGCVDVISCGSDDAPLSTYRYLIAGDDCAPGNAFFGRMLDYVQSGGTLLLTWKNIIPAADLEELGKRGEQVQLDAGAQMLTGVRAVDFSEKIPLLKPSLATRDRRAIENRIGEGRVFLLNAPSFRADSAASRRSGALIRRLAQENQHREAMSGWVSAGSGVYITAYDSPDRRTFYLLCAYRGKAHPRTRRAVLHMGEAECGFPVERDIINVMTLFPGLGVLTAGDAVDIITYDGERLILRGNGSVKLVLFRWSEGEIEIGERRLELNGMHSEKI